jgi:acetyl esterase/lipase
MEIAKDWSVLPEDQAESVIYGLCNGTPLRMFAMKPVQAESASPAPCLIFIHGGGFTGGNAEMLLPYCRYFVRRGFACFSVDYRLMKIGEDGAPLDGEPTLAECIADCKAAVRYVRRHARLWNGDPDRIVLSGESAGGYLASAVTALGHVEEEAADLSVSCVPQFLVVYNPITQLLSKWKMRVEQPVEAHSDDGTEADRWLARHHRARKLSPLLHLTRSHPATLAVHGMEDAVVLPEDSAEYAVRLRDLGVETQFVLLPGLQHAFALTNYKSPDEVVEQTMALTARFLADHGYGTRG